MNIEKMDFFVKLYLELSKKIDCILNFEMNIDVFKSNNLAILDCKNNNIYMYYYYDFDGLSDDTIKFKIRLYYDIVQDDFIFDFNPKINFKDDNFIELSYKAKELIKQDILNQLKKFLKLTRGE